MNDDSMISNGVSVHSALLTSNVINRLWMSFHKCRATNADACIYECNLSLIEHLFLLQQVEGNAYYNTTITHSLIQHHEFAYYLHDA